MMLPHRNGRILLSTSSYLSGAVFAAMLFLPTVLFAAPINYGDFDADTVIYLQVTEDANSPGDSPPLFGAPVVSGNSIDFNPVGFSAAAAEWTVGATLPCVRGRRIARVTDASPHFPRHL